MLRVVATLLAGCVSIALSACGGSDGSGAASGGCVILSNGNKLCGADAKSYCESFTSLTGDPSSLAACKEAGADVEVPLTDQERGERAYGARMDARERKVRDAIRGLVPDSALESIGTSYGDGAAINTYWTRDQTRTGEKLPGNRSPILLPAPDQTTLSNICARVRTAIPEAPGKKLVRNGTTGETLIACDGTETYGATEADLRAVGNRIAAPLGRLPGLPEGTQLSLTIPDDRHVFVSTNWTKNERYTGREVQAGGRQILQVSPPGPEVLNRVCDVVKSNTATSYIAVKVGNEATGESIRTCVR